jgi:hypothetical protein
MTSPRQEPRTSAVERKRRSAAVSALYAAATLCEMYGRHDLVRPLQSLADDIGTYKAKRR